MSIANFTCKHYSVILIRRPNIQSAIALVLSGKLSECAEGSVHGSIERKDETLSALASSSLPEPFHPSFSLLSFPESKKEGEMVVSFICVYVVR